MTTSSFSSAYRGPAGTVNVTAPYNRLGGQGLAVGGLFGVAVRDCSSGDTVAIIPEGRFILAKNAVATAMSAGQRLYWDNSNKQLDTVATVGMYVGVCEEAAGATDATVLVYVDPNPVLLPQTSPTATYAAPSAYSAPTPGGSVPVVSHAATDLDTAAAEIVSLRTQLVALAADVATLKASLVSAKVLV